MKKRVFILLAICMMALLLPVVASAEENNQARIDSTEYPTLAEAIGEAQEGDTVVLLQNVEVSEQITVETSITLDLNGNTITNLVENDWLFQVTASSFTVDGTGADSSMTIPEENTASYGFIKVAAANSEVIINSGSYSGNTIQDKSGDYGGAFVQVYNNGTINATGSAVSFSNATMTSNRRFFRTNTVNAVSFTVTGGTYTTDGMAFGTDTYDLDHSPVVFNGVTVTAGTGPCIEVTGSSATFTDCAFTVTGENSNGFGTTAVAVSWSGTAEINGGTYSAPNGYGVYVYNSGGKITIKDGTVSGGDAAVRADENVQTENGSTQQSTVIVEGGSTVGAWETNDEENAPLVVSGGTHTAENIEDFLAAGTIAQSNGAGGFVVGTEADSVAEIVDGDKYLSLAAAFAAVQDGQTVRMLDDVEVSATVEVHATNLTLDLNGQTISGSVASPGLIRVNTGASLTITDTADTATKGTLINSNQSQAYAVYVLSGGKLALDNGVNLRAEGTNSMNYAAALYIYSNNANAPEVTIRNANLTATKGYAIRFRNTSQAATLKIEGGTFSAPSISASAQLINNDSTSNTTITGGTFHNWSVTMDTPLVAEGYSVVLEDVITDSVRTGTTAQVIEGEPADYAVMEKSLGIYYIEVPDDNLYYVIDRIGRSDRDYFINKSVSCTYPTDEGIGNNQGTPTEMSIELQAGVTLTGAIRMKTAKVTVTGAGVVDDAFFQPFDNSYQVTKTTDGNATVYMCSLESENAVASVRCADGTTYYYSDLKTAITGANNNSGSMLVLEQDISNLTDKDTELKGNWTFDLNGHDITFTGTALSNGSTAGMFRIISSNVGITFTNSQESGGNITSNIVGVSPILMSQRNAHDSTVTIEEGVTINGSVVIINFKNATLNVYGTINSTLEAGIYNNGAETTNSTINLYEGAEVTGYHHAIYHPGTGTLNVYGGATVTGDSVGIEMRKGTLNVYEGAVISGGTDGETTSTANGSGTTTQNAAIAVAQHGDSTDPVVINILGGTLNGTSSVYESNPHNNGTESTDLIELNLRDGSYVGAVFSETQKEFINGGNFSQSVNSAWLNSNLKYEVKDGDSANATPYSYYSSIDEAAEAAGTTGEIQSTTAASNGETATEYTVTFTNRNSSYSVKVAENETITLPTPSRSGYTFIGWQDASGNTVTGTVEIQGNTTYTALWRRNNGGSTTYSITTPGNVSNGTVRVSPTRASYGSTITITVAPDKGYELDALTVTDASGNAVTVTKVSDTKYTFSMPRGNVTISASFVEVSHADICPSAVFTDVNTNAWYHESIDYVIENELMNGVSNNRFNPNGDLNRAMMVRILWNLDGNPTGGSGNYSDVASDAWYYDAVLWAASNSIVMGYPGDTFGPEKSITRQEMVAMLYRYAEHKGYDMTAAGDLNRFTDGNKTAGWAETAVTWAVGSQLLNGKGGILDPAGTATRAEVAQIFMNFCKNIVD